MTEIGECGIMRRPPDVTVAAPAQEVLSPMPNQYTTATDPTPPERFWSKVEFTESCWLWLGGLRDGRYGGFTAAHQVKHFAHRWAYEFCVGPIPEGLTLDHLCHNEDESCLDSSTCLHRICVNPDHLEPATRKENVLRGHGITAQYARQTHCLRGHLFSEENTYRPPKRPTTRSCRACQKTRSVAWLQRQP